MRIGIVGDGDDVAVRPATAVERAGGTPVEGEVASVLDADPSVVVALGEAALLALVRAGAAVPILPVDAGVGVRSVPVAALEGALSRVVSGDWTTSTRRPLAVDVNHRRAATAFMDVMLVTDEPARISEYRVSTPVRPVGQFRADGVVVATPQGSHGYNRNLDGPLLAPETDTVSVVPVAPFAIDHEQWVLDTTTGLSLTVERDEVAVSLFADDRRIDEIGPSDRIDVTGGEETSLVVTEESGRLFEEEA